MLLNLALEKIAAFKAGKIGLDKLTERLQNLAKTAHIIKQPGIWNNAISNELVLFNNNEQKNPTFGALIQGFVAALLPVKLAFYENENVNLASSSVPFVTP